MTLKGDMVADLAAMLDTDEFASSGTYSPKAYATQHPSNKSTTVNGIFDHDFVEINGVEAYNPIFSCATEDLCDVSHGAKLTIHTGQKKSTKDVTYTIRGVQPDGTGLTLLILEAP